MRQPWRCAPAASANGRSASQEAYPVIDDAGRLVGLITADDLRAVSSEPDLVSVVNATDVMRAPIPLLGADDLNAALKDPARLFNSSLDDNVRRAIDIHEGDTIDAKAFKALIRAAVTLNKSKAKS